MSTPTTALVEDTAPQSATDLAEYMGIYRLDDGGEIMIGGMPGNDQLICYDQPTARIAALYPTPDGGFTHGPALLVPEPVEARLSFERDDQGAISALIRQRGEQQAERARKIALDREELRFHNGDVTLAGTLIRPTTAGPHPAAVLIHGSGPQARQHVQPIADFFAHHGVAALIYDKRGVGASTGDWTHSSFDELVADALAGLRLLCEHPDIRADQIGLWGRSQGGWLGPLAASRCDDVAFIISVVGPATSVFQQDLDRVENQMRADGMAEDLIAEALAYINLLIEVVRSGEGWPRLKAVADQARDAAWAPYVTLPESEDELGWFRMNDYDPLPVLRGLTCPILALFGERDMVVPVATNLALMQQALSDNPDHTIVVLPRAGHSPLIVQTGGPAEMPGLSHYIPEYFTIMADWLRERVGTEVVASSHQRHAET